MPGHNGHARDDTYRWRQGTNRTNNYAVQTTLYAGPGELCVSKKSRAFNHACGGRTTGVDLILLTGCPKVLAYAVERKRAPGETIGFTAHCS